MFHLYKNFCKTHTRTMATLKAIQHRLKSVKNVQKITRSMKMVSSSKFTKSEKDLRKVVPMGESCLKFYEKAEVPALDLKTLQDSCAKFLTVMLCSDRGLCGPAHNNVIRKVRRDCRKDEENLIKIIAVGEKAKTSMWRMYGKKILFSVKNVGRINPTFLDASSLSNKILKRKFSGGKVVYNKFKSVVSFETLEMDLLAVPTIQKAEKLYLYDELDDEVISCYVEFSLVAQLYYCMKQGSVSEQSARMTAMENATKNAGDMIAKLTLAYNRTRQAVITRELIEIISGAACLEDEE